MEMNNMTPMLSPYTLIRIVLKSALAGLALVITLLSASAASYTIQITAAHTFQPPNTAREKRRYSEVGR
jgi:hypothetical protein